MRNDLTTGIRPAARLLTGIFSKAISLSRQSEARMFGFCAPFSYSCEALRMNPDTTRLNQLPNPAYPDALRVLGYTAAAIAIAGGIHLLTRGWIDNDRSGDDRDSKDDCQPRDPPPSGSGIGPARDLNKEFGLNDLSHNPVPAVKSVVLEIA
jgi:hypothetical protein